MIVGCYVWQYCDIRTSPDVGLNRARGYNNKGLVNEYRRPKQAYFAVKDAYSKY
jgi:beta-glucuronidase